MYAFFGSRQVFEKLNSELKMVMQLAGTKNIEDIKNYNLRVNDQEFRKLFPTENWEISPEINISSRRIEVEDNINTLKDYWAPLKTPNF